MIIPGKMTSEVLRHVSKKPATISYPAKKVEMPSDFRGKLTFTPSRCKGCMLCTKDCPSGAIKIIKLPDKKIQCEIDLDKCIYCAQCVDSCNFKALAITPDYELAALSRSKLKLVINPENAPPLPEGTEPAPPSPKKPQAVKKPEESKEAKEDKVEKESPKLEKSAESKEQEQVKTAEPAPKYEAKEETKINATEKEPKEAGETKPT